MVRGLSTLQSLLQHLREPRNSRSFLCNSYGLATCKPFVCHSYENTRVYLNSSHFGTQTPPHRAGQNSDVHIRSLDPGRNCQNLLRLDDAILALSPRSLHQECFTTLLRSTGSALFPKNAGGVMGLPPKFLKDDFNFLAISAGLSTCQRPNLQMFRCSFPLHTPLHTVCPPAGNMLGFRLQKSPGPAPRRSQRCARPFLSVSLRHLLGAERLSGKNEAKLRTRNA
jgi:hypothetical protein